MKKTLAIAIASLLALQLSGCGKEERQPEPLTLDSDANKASYLLGYELAKQMQRDGVVVNADAVAQGARDAVASSAVQVSDDSALEVVDTTASNYLVVRQEVIALQRKQSNPNWQAGQQFLTENASKDGVVTTDSGLQYQVLTEGSGARPEATDEVEVHYHGTLIDGTVFDSSVDRDQKITFPLNRVIPGWTEGVQLMKEGAKYRFFIPSELAYGGRAAGPTIQPHSTLVFDVELFKVNP
ncbi:FKBP-type peptidyl-prolyl cis-trans isomerase [bacterium SCSIO 12696]|nr:FKBP-type peptidyl-prolyl cis-trans isomerase [bacterium SCSIO 12696]